LLDDPVLLKRAWRPIAILHLNSITGNDRRHWWLGLGCGIATKLFRAGTVWTRRHFGGAGSDRAEN